MNNSYFNNLNLNTMRKIFTLFVLVFLSFNLLGQCTPDPGGQIEEDQLICVGTQPDEIVSVNEPVGHDFLWLSRTEFETEFSAIANSNSPHYQPDVLGVTTYYMRCALPTGCTDWQSASETNIITIAVDNTLPIVAISATGWQPTTVTADLLPNTTYSWDIDNDGVEDYNSNEFTHSFSQTTTITLTTMSGVCSYSQAFEVNLSVLPVTLRSFTAELKEDGDVYLKWITSTELNNDYFSIINNSNIVGKVEGYGNSTQEREYQFSYTPEEGNNYVYLRQVDFDGKSENSEILTITHTREVIQGLIFDILGQAKNNHTFKLIDGKIFLILN